MEAAEGRTAHNNVWNGANGMASNHVFDVLDTIPLIPLQPLPQVRPPQLKVPPTSCGCMIVMAHLQNDISQEQQMTVPHGSGAHQHLRVVTVVPLVIHRHDHSDRRKLYFAIK